MKQYFYILLSSLVVLGYPVALLAESPSMGAIQLLLDKNLPADVYRGFENETNPDLLRPRSGDELTRRKYKRIYDDFYRTDASVAAGENELESLALVRTDTFARKGQFSLRAFLKSSDPASWPGDGFATARAELFALREHENGYGWNDLPAEGSERWYGLSVLFPDSFVFGPDSVKHVTRFVFCQWQHGSPGSPAIALEVLGEKLVLQRHFGSAPDSLTYSDHDLGKIERGKWIDLVLKVIWAKDSRGQLQVWRNNNLVHEELNTNTVYDNKTNGGRMKFGIYYWNWDKKARVETALANGITHRELFIDEVSLYEGEHGFDRVNVRSQ